MHGANSVWEPTTTQLLVGRQSETSASQSARTTAAGAARDTRIKMPTSDALVGATFISR
jgi:hypothetical protein